MGLFDFPATFHFFLLSILSNTITFFKQNNMMTFRLIIVAGALFFTAREVDANRVLRRLVSAEIRGVAGKAYIPFSRRRLDDMGGLQGRRRRLGGPEGGRRRL